jgi:hypothetical protein
MLAGENVYVANIGPVGLALRSTTPGYVPPMGETWKVNCRVLPYTPSTDFWLVSTMLKSSGVMTTVFVPVAPEAALEEKLTSPL